ncbi:MAG: ArnT family glycosyltransferase [bacterium]
MNNNTKLKLNSFLSLSVFDIAVLCALAVWLLFSAFIVDIEYYDGFDTICNTRFFIGESTRYISNRAPFFSLILIPAEWIKKILHLHPLEVRPYHFIMALFHIAYIIGVYSLLVKYFKRKGAVLLAFLAAIPTFIFFSYGPFISHDIFPGIIFLVMLVLADKFYKSPQIKTWLLLTILGACAALIKQTYGIFWVAILGSQILLFFFQKDRDKKKYLSVLSFLGAGALVSGLITWIVLMFTLSGTYPNKSVLFRPYYQMLFILNQYEGASPNLFPWWVYIRNFWAYGTLNVLLIIPGIVMAFRKSRLQKGIALSWMIFFIIMHLLSMREVRYLYPLAPMSAFLIVPVIQSLIKNRIALICIVIILLLDFKNFYPEITRIINPFYTRSVTREFLQPLESIDKKKDQIIIGNRSMLSFPGPYTSPLVGDRYHHLFHFAMHHVIILYGYSPENLIRIPNIGKYKDVLYKNKNTCLIFANNTIVNSTSWYFQPPMFKDELIQLIAFNQSLTLYKQSDRTFKTPGGDVVSLRIEKNQGIQQVMIESELLFNLLRDSVFSRLMDTSKNNSFDLQLLPTGKIQILGVISDDELRKSKLLFIQLLKIKRILYIPFSEKEST